LGHGILSCFIPASFYPRPLPFATPQHLAFSERERFKIFGAKSAAGE